MIIEKYGKHFDYSSIDRNTGWRLKTIADRSIDGLNLGKIKESISCPVCGGNDHDDIIEIYSFTYAKCLHCELVYLPEISNVEKLKEMYLNNDQELQKTPGDDLINSDNFRARVDLICKPKVDFVLENTKDTNPKWVDFGCGVGDIVMAASEKGCDAVGYDIDNREVEHGQMNGSNIFCKDINENNAKEIIGGADIISFISVLEHIPNCSSVLDMAVKASKDDANFIIEVPRFNSVSSLINLNFDDKVSRHMLPPNHVMLFTDNAFDYMLKKVGLKIDAIWYYGMDINELFGTLLLNKASRYLDIGDLKTLLNEMQLILDKSKLCDEMLVVCSKD